MAMPMSQNNDPGKSPAAVKPMVVALAIVSLLTSGLIVLYMVTRPGDGAATAADVPVWYDLPDFSLVDHEDRPFTISDFRGGQVSIVNFIFTRCQGPCPRMTSAMAGLQIELRKGPMWDRVQLVSVSVDPEHDTPAVLRQYAGWAHAEPGKWRFVTGSRADVWKLIVEGFKLPVGEATDNPAEPIFHSQKFVLVDGTGRVRGAYDGLEPEAREKMLRDVDVLLSKATGR